MRWVSIALWMVSTPAFAAEYRSITLANGRSIPAQIGEITATEMVLSTPQGEVRIAPNELRSMDPLSAEDYAAHEAWRVLVLPFSGDNTQDNETARLYINRVIKGIPAVQTVTVDALPPSVGETTRRALAICGTDLQCATRHGSDAGVDIVVMGKTSSTAQGSVLDVGAVFVDTPEARQRESILYDDALLTHRSSILKATYKVLFLSPPPNPVLPEDAVAPAVAAASPVVSSTASAPSASLAWTPLPGITALNQGNPTGFATAVGIVGVGTAASVAWSGYASYSAPQMVAMSALTSYGLTVFVNHMFVTD